MKLMAIDPGTSLSAFVIYDVFKRSIIKMGIKDNYTILEEIGQAKRDYVDYFAIEEIKSYGNVVGDCILKTVVWAGRFIQAWGNGIDSRITRLPRKTIVTYICNNPRAKDKNVRHALIDRFTEYGPLGGGKTPSIGTKASPGALYGVSEDLWSALAVAEAWCDNEGLGQKTKERREVCK